MPCGPPHLSGTGSGFRHTNAPPDRISVSLDDEGIHADRGPGEVQDEAGIPLHQGGRRRLLGRVQEGSDGRGRFLQEEEKLVNAPVRDAELDHVTGLDVKVGGKDPGSIPPSAQQDLMDSDPVVDPQGLSQLGVGGWRGRLTTRRPQR